MTTFVFRRRLTVEYGHCDPAGVAFMSQLYQYFDTSTWLLFEAALGLKAQDIMATLAIMPLVDVRADCRKPLRFGDAVEIASRISEFRRSSFNVEHRITIDGELAVEGGETRVWAVRDKDDGEKISSRPIPPEIVARFS